MSTVKILLVDDEVVFTDNMTRLLNARGYQAEAVNSGAAAIQRLQQQAFDVVVLDLKMPDMDGLATLKEINQLNLPVQTLILTGHGAMNTALEALKHGAYDYLTKPCEIGELVVKIDSAFRKKEYMEHKAGGGRSEE